MLYTTHGKKLYIYKKFCVCDNKTDEREREKEREKEKNWVYLFFSETKQSVSCERRIWSANYQKSWKFP